jgi:hypothetical protein
MKDSTTGDCDGGKSMLYRFNGKKPVVVIGQGALTKNTEMAKKDALFGPFEVFLRQCDA